MEKLITAIRQAEKSFSHLEKLENELKAFSKIVLTQGHPSIARLTLSNLFQQLATCMSPHPSFALEAYNHRMKAYTHLSSGEAIAEMKPSSPALSNAYGSSTLNKLTGSEIKRLFTSLPSPDEENPTLESCMNYMLTTMKLSPEIAKNLRRQALNDNLEELENSESKKPQHKTPSQNLSSLLISVELSQKNISLETFHLHAISVFCGKEPPRVIFDIIMGYHGELFSPFQISSQNNTHQADGPGLLGTPPSGLGVSAPPIA